MMPVLPRDSGNIIGRSTNVSTTGVLPSVERIGSHGPTRKAGSPKGRVSQYDIQNVTPDGSTPVAGSVIPVPSGLWFLTLGVDGNYDDILLGFTWTLTGPGGGDFGFSAWVAHRPSGALESSAGTLTAIPVSGGTVTAGIAVDGAGEDDVRIITRFDPCEAP